MKELRARLRKRHDRDIQRAVERLIMEEGEMSDLVREGVRMILRDRGVMEYEGAEPTRGNTRQLTIFVDTQAGK